MADEQDNGEVGGAKIKVAKADMCGASLARGQNSEELSALLTLWRLDCSTVLALAKDRIERITADCSIKHVNVSRMKRQESIIPKLREHSSLSLSSLQDMAGCRTIVYTLEDVYHVVEQAVVAFDKTIDRIDDHIKVRKSSGYRSVHLVLCFESEGHYEKSKKYVEWQVRTVLQHIWATAVESFSISLNQDFKRGQGDAKWLRFLALMSLAIADREIGDVKKRLKDKFRKELCELIIELAPSSLAHAIVHVERKLNDDSDDKPRWFLVEHIKGERSDTSVTYMNDDEEAMQAFHLAEGQAAGVVGHNVYMVQAESYREMVEAYPNMFSDLIRFFEIMAEVVDEELAALKLERDESRDRAAKLANSLKEPENRKKL